MKITTRNAYISIMMQQPFRAGAMMGTQGAPYGKGWMQDKYDIAALDEAMEKGIVYSVMSYDTPIYWVTRDGAQYITREKHSATTSRHQSQCRRM